MFERKQNGTVQNGVEAVSNGDRASTVNSKHKQNNNKNKNSKKDKKRKNKYGDKKVEDEQENRGGDDDNGSPVAKTLKQDEEEEEKEEEKVVVPVNIFARKVPSNRGKRWTQRVKKPIVQNTKTEWVTDSITKDDG